MFKKLHWNAQFHTPHGRLVRVENYTLRRSRPGESFSCWKDAIKEVCVVSVQPNVATDMYPYVTRGESYDHVELSDDLPYNSEREIRENEVRVGRVIVKTTWLGFSYCNPHRPSQALRNIRTSIHNTTRAKIQEVLNYATGMSQSEFCKRPKCRPHQEFGIFQARGISKTVGVGIFHQLRNFPKIFGKKHSRISFANALRRTRLRLPANRTAVHADHLFIVKKPSNASQLRKKSRTVIRQNPR